MVHLTVKGAFLFIQAILLCCGPLDLAAQESRPRNFSLQISGQVRNADSRQPVEGALVRIESYAGGLIDQVVTDRTGKFFFSGLNPIQYIVTIHLLGFRDVRDRVDLATSSSGYLNVELVRDREAIGLKKPSDHKPGVIDPNLPIEAQDAVAKAKVDIAAQSKEKFLSAEKHLESAVSIYPKYLEAHIMLGLVRMDLGEWEKAEGPLTKATEIDQNSPAAFLALGEVFLRRRKFAESINALDHGLKLNSNSAVGHLTLAKTHWEMAPASKSKDDFKMHAEAAWSEVTRALKIDPNLAEAHLLAGNLLLKAGRTARALDHFETYLKLEPKGEFAEPTRGVIKQIKDAIGRPQKS